MSWLILQILWIRNKICSFKFGSSPLQKLSVSASNSHDPTLNTSVHFSNMWSAKPFMRLYRHNSDNKNMPTRTIGKIVKY